MRSFADAVPDQESSGGDILLPEGTCVALRLKITPHNPNTNPPTYDKPSQNRDKPGLRTLQVDATIEGGHYNGGRMRAWLRTENPSGQDDSPAFKSILEAQGASPSNPARYQVADWGDFDGMIAFAKTHVEKGEEYEVKANGQPTGEKRISPDRSRIALWISPIAQDKAHIDAMAALMQAYGGQLPPGKGAQAAPAAAPVAAGFGGALAPQQQVQPQGGPPPAAGNWDQSQPAGGPAPAPHWGAPQPQQPQQQPQQPPAPNPAGAWNANAGVQHTAPLPHHLGGPQ